MFRNDPTFDYYFFLSFFAKIGKLLPSLLNTEQQVASLYYNAAKLRYYQWICSNEAFDLYSFLVSTTNFTASEQTDFSLSVATPILVEYSEQELWSDWPTKISFVREAC